MTTNQKSPARPPAQASDTASTVATPPVPADILEPQSTSMQYSFAAHQWLDPFDYRNVKISAGHACHLVNSVVDVVSGVETVMELIAAHAEDESSDKEVSPLSPFHLGNLNRLSIYALRRLGDDADSLREVVRNIANKG